MSTRRLYLDPAIFWLFAKNYYPSNQYGPVSYEETIGAFSKIRCQLNGMCKGSYFRWLLFIAKQQAKIGDTTSIFRNYNLVTIYTMLRVYDNIRHTGLVKKDIYEYKSLVDFYKEVTPYINYTLPTSKKKSNKFYKNGEAVAYGDKSSGTFFIEVNSREAAVQFGGSSQWCISSTETDSHYKNFVKSYHILFFNHNKNRYAGVIRRTPPYNNSFYTVTDDPIGEFSINFPELRNKKFEGMPWFMNFMLTGYFEDKDIINIYDMATEEGYAPQLCTTVTRKITRNKYLSDSKKEELCSFMLHAGVLKFKNFFERVDNDVLRMVDYVTFKAVISHVFKEDYIGVPTQIASLLRSLSDQHNKLFYLCSQKYNSWNTVIGLFYNHSYTTSISDLPEMSLAALFRNSSKGGKFRPLMPIAKEIRETAKTTLLKTTLDTVIKEYEEYIESKEEDNPYKFQIFKSRGTTDFVIPIRYVNFAIDISSSADNAWIIR